MEGHDSVEVVTLWCSMTWFKTTQAVRFGSIFCDQGRKICQRSINIPITNNKRDIAFLCTIWTSHCSQICELRGELRLLWAVRHGPSDRGHQRRPDSDDRRRLPGEQLCRGASASVRVPSSSGQSAQDRRLRVPGRSHCRRMQRAVPHISVQVPFLRLRRHRRDGLSSQSPLTRHSHRYTGKRDYHTHSSKEIRK